MSVTFEIIDGPEIETSEPCFQCEQLRDFGEEGPCSLPFCEDGRMVVRLPETSLNVSDLTASCVFAALGLLFEHAGEFAAEDVPQLRRRILKVLNTDISDHVLEPFVAGEQVRVRQDEGNVVRLARTGPRYIEFGVPQGRLERRLCELDEICAEAVRLGKGIRWS